MRGRVIPCPVESVIFQDNSEGNVVAYLPNGRSETNSDDFGWLIFASTNYPRRVCERLAEDICNREVAFPFYLNIWSKK